MRQWLKDEYGKMNAVTKMQQRVKLSPPNPDDLMEYDLEVRIA